MTILTKSILQNVSEESLLIKMEREREKERKRKREKEKEREIVIEIENCNNLEAIYCVRGLLIASVEELFEDLK
jgi:uncharacterized protein with ACT and thioredoxin-like domain